MLRQILLIGLILVVPLSCTGCRAKKPDSLFVPQGAPVIVDGTISPGEWDQARVEAFADGSELLLMYGDDHLYLGIRSSTPEMIVGNVFLNRKEEIRILHTSAALGTAIYQRTTDGWQQAQAFDWQCRRTENSAAVQAERDAFFHNEGWVSINSRMGMPNELEYQIKVPDGPLRLAVNYIRASEPTKKIPWPGDLDDDCVKPTPGGLPAQMYFSPDRWAAIDLP
jgi:hypothetical protein